MGERKGTNKYYPPDFDPQKHRNLAGYTGQHPLRERARKLHLGILIIRFEMPYNIWCDGCNNHIGMGVRYNAEKSKVGMYYTTPIYKFRMKCHLCDNHFEIKTDPANHDYVIISGARRKEQRWDPKENEQIVTDDKEDIKKLASDPMYKLEHGIDDKQKIKAALPTIHQIAQLQDSKPDDYILNKLARSKFREEKKQLQQIKNEDTALLSKSSLDIPLVKETEDDKKMAQMLKYQTVTSYDEKKKKMRNDIMSQSIFDSHGQGHLNIQETPSSSSASSGSGSSDSSKKQQVAMIHRQLNKSGAKQFSFGRAQASGETGAGTKDKQQALGIVRKSNKSTEGKPTRNSSISYNTPKETDQTTMCSDLKNQTDNNREQIDNRVSENTDKSKHFQNTSRTKMDNEDANMNSPSRCYTSIISSEHDGDFSSDRGKTCDRTVCSQKSKGVSVTTNDNVHDKPATQDSSLKALAGMYNTSSESENDT